MDGDRSRDDIMDRDVDADATLRRARSGEDDVMRFVEAVGSDFRNYVSFPPLRHGLIKGALGDPRQMRRAALTTPPCRSGTTRRRLRDSTWLLRRPLAPPFRQMSLRVR